MRRLTLSITLLFCSLSLALPLQAQTQADAFRLKKIQQEAKPNPEARVPREQVPQEQALQKASGAPDMDVLIRERMLKSKQIPTENEVLGSITKFLEKISQPDFKFFETLNSKTFLESFDVSSPASKSEASKRMWLEKSRSSQSSEEKTDRFIETKDEKRLEAFKAFMGIKLGTDSEKASPEAKMNPDEASKFLLNSLITEAFKFQKKSEEKSR